MITIADICTAYQQYQTLNKTAKALHINYQKVRKALIHNNIYSTELSKEIKKLQMQGISKNEICKKLKISQNLYSAHTPYIHEPINHWNNNNIMEHSKNAIKIKKCRDKIDKSILL